MEHVEEYPEGTADAVVEYDRRVTELEAAKAEIAERIKAEGKQFKAQTGIPLGTVKKARDDAAIEDDEKRAKKLQDYTACFNALNGNEQLSLLTGLTSEAA